MLNDINLNTLEIENVDNILTQTKTVFHEHVPYKLLDSAIARDEKIPVFNQHFIDTMRLVLSEPDGGCIIQMSPAERNVYYSFIEYQDGVIPTDSEMLLVVEKLNDCIINELTCKVATYIDQCFGVEHTWDACPTTDASTLSMTQAAYDALSVVNKTTMYVITSNGEVVKVYLGSIVLWTAP